MSKHIQLSIADPCHENWDNMTKVEKGKFCGSCQKQVIDFSNMSDRAVAQFFKKPSTGSVCGRFMQDQLDRSIEIPKKRIPWVKYFFQFALPAFLMSMKVSAQGKIKPATIFSTAPQPDCTKIMGKIASPEKRTVVGDTLTMPYQRPGKSDTLLTEKVLNKEFVSSIKTQGVTNFQDTITLPEVVIVSYANVMGKISMGTPTQIVADSTVPVLSSQNVTSFMAGSISVCRYSETKASKDSSIKNFFTNIVSKSIKFFPNPAKAGSSLNIEWKRNESGSFMLQLLNVSGQVIFHKEIWIGEESHLIEVQLPFVDAGNYFLQMTNKKSGKSFTEKIIIQ